VAFQRRTDILSEIENSCFDPFCVIPLQLLVGMEESYVMGTRKTLTIADVVTTYGAILWVSVQLSPCSYFFSF